MTAAKPKEHWASLSLPIIRTARGQHRNGDLTVGSLLTALGETSFGWAIVLFSVLTLLPLPPGSSVITGLPLLWATGQMALGYPHVRLPGPLSRTRIDETRLRRAVHSLRPVTRRLERLLRPRHTAVFSRRNEQRLGVLLFAIAFALFLPVPLTGWFPAAALFTVGVGIVERDGLVVGLGLAFGAFSVLLTAGMLFSIVAGAEALAG